MNLQLIDDFYKLKIDAGPSKEKVKKNGEVFTPAKLINEMLDELPIDVWKQKDYKWFDPAAGCGQFLWEVYKRLIKNFDKEHIIKNMLYMSDLCEENYKECLKVFGENANVHNVNTLEYDWDVKFDIIVGNPPYNAPNHIGRGITIWQKFVWKAFDLLKHGGYLVYVHPASWRKPQNNNTRSKGLYNKMVKECKMLYLSMNDKREGMKTFKADTKYDWYVIKNECPDECFKTKIKDFDGITRMIDIKQWPWLPNAAFDDVWRLIDKEEKVKSLYNSLGDVRSEFIANKIINTERGCVNCNKDDEYKYPLIHTIPKSGPRILYSSRNDIGYFGLPKVIMGLCHPINKIIIDMDGKYGLTNHSFGFYTDNIEEASNIKNALESHAFKRILKACIWSNFCIDWRMFAYFNKDFWKQFV